MNPHPVAYLFGEKMPDPFDHPMVEPSQNAVALTYDLAHDPLHEDLMTATCFQRCAKCDGGNIMNLAAYEVDQKFGTKYHERLFSKS
jgi:4-hydroxybutyryl-CoA dehydratase/vinylacetyl-CoA-Delta-isomerase